MRTWEQLAEERSVEHFPVDGFPESDVRWRFHWGKRPLKSFHWATPAGKKLYRIDMNFSPGCLCRRFIVAALITLMTSSSHAQKPERPILVTHDVIDGPTGGAHRVEVLTIFSNGTVTYTVESKIHNVQPEIRQSLTGKLKPADLGGLANLLNLQEIRELPNDLAAKTWPIDFFWDQSLKIVREDGTQTVHIQNF